MIKTVSRISAGENQRREAEALARREDIKRERKELRLLRPLVQKLIEVAAKIVEGRGLASEQEIKRYKVPFCGRSGMGLDVDESLGTVRILRLRWDAAKRTVILFAHESESLPGTWNDGYHIPESRSESSHVPIRKNKWFELAQILRDHEISIGWLESLQASIKT